MKAILFLLKFTFRLFISEKLVDAKVEVLPCQGRGGNGRSSVLRGGHLRLGDAEASRACQLPRGAGVPQGAVAHARVFVDGGEGRSGHTVEKTNSESQMSKEGATAKRILKIVYFILQTYLSPLLERKKVLILYFTNYIRRHYWYKKVSKYLTIIFRQT